MFNFHTHTETKNAICNIDNTCHELLLENYFYSIGNHPWYNNFTTSQIENYIINNNQILSIGECGLDRYSGKLPLDQQIVILKDQIILSEKYKLPLILHVVKCYNEVIYLKKLLKPKQKWIIHGFNKHKLTAQLIENDFFISFGKALLINPGLQNACIKTPLNKIFLETDDEQLDIEKLYTFTAQLKNISVDVLIQQINNNFKKITNGKLA